MSRVPCCRGHLARITLTKIGGSLGNTDCPRVDPVEEDRKPNGRQAGISGSHKSQVTRVTEELTFCSEHLITIPTWSTNCKGSDFCHFLLLILPVSRTIKIPFRSENHALLVRRVLEVDGELSPKAVQRRFDIQGEILVV